MKLKKELKFWVSGLRIEVGNPSCFAEFTKTKSTMIVSCGILCRNLRTF